MRPNDTALTHFTNKYFNNYIYIYILRSLVYNSSAYFLIDLFYELDLIKRY